MNDRCYDQIKGVVVLGGIVVARRHIAFKLRHKRPLRNICVLRDCAMPFCKGVERSYESIIHYA